MSIALPTVKVKGGRVNPKRILIYSKPKTGKTTAYAGLEDNLILDLENGTDYVEALKIKINSLQELLDTGKAIKEAGCPYKYVTVDTVTALEEMIMPLAIKLYKQTPMVRILMALVLLLYQMVQDIYISVKHSFKF